MYTDMPAYTDVPASSDSSSHVAACFCLRQPHVMLLKGHLHAAVWQCVLLPHLLHYGCTVFHSHNNILIMVPGMTATPQVRLQTEFACPAWPLHVPMFGSGDKAVVTRQCCLPLFRRR